MKQSQNRIDNVNQPSGTVKLKGDCCTFVGQ